jgi:hypothetical protein
MPRGGHSRSGPAPDPTSLRSGSGSGTAGWLPMTVPTDPAPAWPFGTPTEAEAAHWEALWTRPPASLWPRFHLGHDVAIYVRTLVAFEAGGHANAALGSLAARQADQLGLTVAGAHRNKWLFPDPAKAKTVAAPADRHSSAGDIKRRFTILPAREEIA